MFVANIGLSARLALLAEVPFTLEAVEHIFRKAVSTAVVATCRTVYLLSEFYWFLTEITHPPLTFHQLLIALPFFR